MLWPGRFRPWQIVTVLLPENLPAIDVDGRRVEQCLRGLVEAMAAGRRPGEPVAIEAESRDDETLINIAAKEERALDSAGTVPQDGSV